MSRYEVAVENDEGFCFLNTLFPLEWVPSTRAIVQKCDGKIIAAVAYQSTNGYNSFIHVGALPGVRWLTRDLLYWTFAIPFLQWKLQRLTGWVEEDNIAARRFDSHVGFSEEATLKGAGSRGQDVIIYRMLRDECRWLAHFKYLVEAHKAFGEFATGGF